MTTFFKKLFGQKDLATKPEELDIISKTPAPARELFIEDRHPDEFLAPPVPKEIKREKTLLQDLLERDYLAMGHKDGYETHDLSRMELGKELIASDFRLALDQALQDIEGQLEILAKHLTEMAQEIAPGLYEKSHTRHDQLVKQKRDLMLQKDLAVAGDGYVEKPWKYYKAGFIKGYDLYLEEEVIFKHIKTL